ncbi:MAG: cysteine desulfurase family protein [Patescibacteria group bacterium]
MLMKAMRRIYLDYAATTPLDPAVRAAMHTYDKMKFGNPSSLHRFGQEASAAIFTARRLMAGAIGADAAEIVFTASATEANNLAIQGAVAAAHIKKPKILVLVTDHESVLEPARRLARDGGEVVFLPVSSEGMVDPRVVHPHIDDHTVVVSVGYANSETGAVQPVRHIGEAVRAAREAHKSPYPLFHVDAAQALPWLGCMVNIFSADLMTFSSHKIFGPKGAAALYVRNGTNIEPMIIGGSQEGGLRAGTENGEAIVGFGKAIEILGKRAKSDGNRISKLRDQFVKEIKSFWRGADLNGPPSGSNRLPGNANLHLPGISSSELLVRLDLQGIAASAGSACAARTPAPSHVLRGMGLDVAWTKESVRFTLGRQTTAGEIKTTIRVLKNIYEKL